ncbi:hypothetical protein G9A89_018836 [Geosiphon pyriformis]|nr:hypothetical protein G9A89_018836 [Geosiphon pyriformis]
MTNQGQINLVGSLSITSKKNRYIVVTVDYLTKWPEAKAIQVADAKTVAKQCWKKNCLWVRGGEKRGKERKKDYKRRYLVPKLEEIKEALAYGTKLSKTGEWILDNVQEWKERLLPAYWFYKIGEQLDLKTPYKDLSQKTFNKKAIQQVEKFIGKNNLTLHYKAVYRLYFAFQHCPNVLLYGSIKMITVNNIRQITNQQFEDL